jgi:hypothetical protein
MKITNLISKLAPFIREYHKQINKIRQIDWDVDWLKADNNWVLKMPLSIHYNIIYYIRFRKDAANTNKLNKVFI